MTKRKKHKRRRTRSSGNQMVKMMGDTAKFAIGATAVTAITATTIAALKPSS